MPYLRALLSAVTIFGGHLLNGRLDRVVLIVGVLVLAALAVMLSWWVPDIANPPGPQRALWLIRAPAIVVIAIAIGSALLTWVDARRGRREPLSVLTWLAGGTISLVGLAAVWVAVFSRVVPPSTSSAGDQAFNEATSPDFGFHASVYFGGAGSFDLPPPPKGPHPLRGRILLDGKGAAGVVLEMRLNGQFKTQRFKTDSRGEFSVGLPEGNWSVNDVAAQRWTDRPRNRRLILFSGLEPRVGDESRYWAYPALPQEGLPVRLPASSDSIPLSLEFRDAIQVDWPTRRDRYDSDGTAGGTSKGLMQTSAITWQPVKSASQYEIQIDSVIREGRRTRFSSLQFRHQPGTTLPVASLGNIKSPGSNKPAEYSVTIHAFDAEGRLLSSSSTGPDEHTFILENGFVLTKD